MRKQMQMLGSTLGRAAVTVVVSLGLTSAASAGTVYSWQTEDGTAAYTDDRKQIPSRYREQANARSMKQLANYKRYTESEIKVDGSYSPRLHARLDHLREGGAVAMLAPGPGGKPTSAALLVQTSGGRRGTGSQFSIPVDGSDAEPITVQSVRVRPNSAAGLNGSLSTHHVTVVRQGDRVLSVTTNERGSQILHVPTENELIGDLLDLETR